MSDMTYTESSLSDWCGGGSTRGSSWISISALVVSVVALAAGLFAAFAPRNVVDRASQKVSEAVSKGKSKARELAEAAREEAESVSSSMRSPQPY